jgi:hypothetical protein
LPSSLSAHPTLSIPALDAFQLHLTPLNFTPTVARTERPSGEVFGAAKAPEGATNDPMKKLEEAMRRAFQGDEDDGDGTYEQQTDC